MFSDIEKSILPIRSEITTHKVYQQIKSLKDLQIFMQFHVYAVWDFMSLLKAIQQHLTCTTVPWFPIGDGNSRALINQIVAGEESDLDSEGNQLSHFEMYLQAMDQCGADTSGINTFVHTLKQTGDFQHSYTAANTPLAARTFVDHTFSVIVSNQPHLMASAFTYGREDLIPDMFTTMVNELEKQFPDQLKAYKYYLDRHIEIDGDEHGHMAISMTEQLCGNDPEKINSAALAATESLHQRVGLWDGALHAIQQQQR